MSEQPRTLGTHLLVELNDCDSTLLDDLELVKKTLLDAADEAGATVVGEVFHKFSPIGVTGIICIAESHISIHTWPEHAYAAVDIFTCSEDFKPHEAADYIAASLQSKRPAITEVKRGALGAPQLVAT